MKNKSLKKFISLLLCAVMLFSFQNMIFADGDEDGEAEEEEVAQSVSEDEPADEESKASPKTEEDYKSQLSDLQSKQKDIQKQQTELNKKINNVKNQKNEQLRLAATIDEEIDVLRQNMQVCEEKIELTEAYIGNKEKQIGKKQDDIDTTLDTFRSRIRAMYMTGGYSDATNSIIMLLSSRSISEFLTRAEYLTRIAVHDNELVTDLKAEMDELEQEKAVLVSDREALEKEVAELEAAKEELDSKLEEAQSSVQDLQAMQREYEANYSELSKIAKQIQSELADIYKSLTLTDAAYVGGEMMWPCPGFSTISCGYGWRFNGSDFHTGIDIAGGGIYGTKVVAANTGTVIFTKVCPYNGYAYGYGTYCIIDHGGYITTLYAHLSSLSVKEGDIVAMGEQIGTVGSTGWSTGAHLHFEVRKNGSSTNPIPYVTG